MAKTIKDIAENAGVGVGTVSRVINGEKSVNPETRKKVLEAMERLDYRPNQMASRLRRNKTGILALLVPVIDHPFFAKLAEYVEDEADKFGYSVILVSSQRRVLKEREIMERLRRREMDGAVFVTHFAHEESLFKDCCVVSIDREFGGDIPYVTSNNYDSTADAVKYLIEKGCKNIGFIGSKPLVNSEVSERVRAYRDVMNKYGMPDRSMNEVINHGEENSVVESFLSRFDGVDGVFASGYTMAQVLYETALKKGLRIPDDLQIISYDGAFSQWNNNRVLTCVEQPVERMAREVVRLLVKKINNEETPHRTVFETSFVKGATTR